MKGQPVIIVRKRRAEAHAHHGGAWKVAYADFVTAMMAFFLVMWIITQSTAVRAGVAGYFRDPGVLEQQRSNGILEGNKAGIDPKAPATLRPAAPKVDQTAIRAALEQSAKHLQDSLAKLPGFDKLKEQVQIKFTPEGMQIELIDSDATTFFDTASATLKPQTARILALIAKELGPLGKPVFVEGHTDSQPYTSSASYTNWELSADRANAARREMEKDGLPQTIIQGVRGFADRVPAYPSNLADPRNRRVSIVVIANPAMVAAALK